MKLDQPAAIDGPDQTGTAGTVERTMAAAAEQGRALQKRTTDRPRTGMPAPVFGLPVDASSGGSALQRKFARSKGTLGAASSPCSVIGFSSLLRRRPHDGSVTLCAFLAFVVVTQKPAANAS
jgi:hypothetical protein